jgi:peptidoglycan/xylan/chitin deacetylase (PgdA/CDA1 family)
LRRVVLTGLFVAPLIAIAVWQWSAIGAIGVIALSHALLLYPTLRPNVQWLGPVITRFDTDGKEVWLTIDDGPTDDTPALLDLFDRRGAKATFFVKGTRAEEQPEMIREMIRRGHTVANHSWSHPSGTFWCLPPDRIAEQIERCNDVLQKITGTTPLLFRAPVGTKNPGVHPALRRLGMTLVGWSSRAFDTRTNDPEVVVKRIMPDITPGAIILLHQGRRTSVQMLDRVIEEAQRLGYRFVIPPLDRLKTNR